MCYFSHCCDKILDRSHLHGKRFTAAHGLRGNRFLMAEIADWGVTRSVAWEFILQPTHLDGFSNRDLGSEVG